MVTYIIIGAAVLALILFVSMCYIKAPSNVALIISGLSKEPRVLVGRGGFRVPGLERVDRLFLGQVSIDVKTESSVSTSDFILCNCDGVCKVAVKGDAAGMRIAARHFLNFKPEMIANQVKDTLQGNLREIIGKTSLKSLTCERNSFSEQVASSAGKDMAELGLTILSFNLQNVSDSQGLIQALGEENSSKIRQNAAIQKAMAEKEIAKAQAENKKAAEDARIESETAIAEKQNQLDLKKAELKRESDAKKAIADAAYEIQRQEQLKTINTKTIEAEIEKTKQEQILSKERVKITENELEATVQKNADAKKYEIEKNAAAALEQKKRLAEAQRYEAEQAALAQNAEAEAKKYAMEQEALGIKAKGDAEAYAIAAKGKAEAETIEAQLKAEAEGMDKKAEAYKKYNEAAVIQMMMDKLPEMTKAIADSISGVKGITIYGGGLENVSASVPVMIRQAMDTLKSATGVDVSGLIESNSIKAKTDRNINVSGLPEVPEIKNEKGEED